MQNWTAQIKLNYTVKRKKTKKAEGGGELLLHDEESVHHWQMKH